VRNQVSDHSVVDGSCSGSRRRSQELEEPPGRRHVRPQGLGPPPQVAIRRDERDPLAGGVRDDLDEQVVTAAGGMEHGDAADQAVVGALASPAFEDHDDGLGDPPPVNGGPHLLDEGSGRPRSVPPPARRTRTHHVGCIDEEHRTSLVGSAIEPVEPSG
jgi:hypothetical protein